VSEGKKEGERDVEIARKCRSGASSAQQEINNAKSNKATSHGDVGEARGEVDSRGLGTVGQFTCTTLFLYELHLLAFCFFTITSIMSLKKGMLSRSL
jgi:hypothetical protein